MLQVPLLENHLIDTGLTCCSNLLLKQKDDTLLNIIYSDIALLLSQISEPIVLSPR